MTTLKTYNNIFLFSIITATSMSFIISLLFEHSLESVFVYIQIVVSMDIISVIYWFLIRNVLKEVDKK